MAADGFIIAGDLFDTERVSPSVIENLLGIIASFPEITFFYLYGNHERKIIEENAEQIPENLKLFGEDWTGYKLGKINIFGRGETDAGMFRSLTLNPEEKNIILLHGELRDRSDKNGIIGERELSELACDYVALGHYHTYSAKKIGERAIAVYPGTPEGRGFDEAGDKGYVILEISDDALTHRFVKSAKRALRIAEIDVSGLERTIDIEDRVLKEISTVSRDDMLRVLLIGTHEPGQKIDTDAIKAYFENRFYYFEIKDKTRTRISMNDYKNDKSLKGEFIRGVLADDTLSDEEKERVIDMGLAVLMNEEI